MEHITAEELTAQSAKLDDLLADAPAGHPVADALQSIISILARASYTVSDLEGRVTDALAAVEMLRSQPFDDAEFTEPMVELARAEQVEFAVAPMSFGSGEAIDLAIIDQVAAMLPSLRAEVLSRVEPQIERSPVTVGAAAFDAAPAAPVMDAPVIERAPLSPFAVPATPQASAPSASTERVGFAPRAQSYEAPFASHSLSATLGDAPAGDLLADLLDGTGPAPAAPTAPTLTEDFFATLTAQPETTTREAQPHTRPGGAARPVDAAAMADLARPEAAPRPLGELREPVAAGEPILPPWAQ
jgi:hypothetical protein